MMEDTLADDLRRSRQRQAGFQQRQPAGAGRRLREPLPQAGVPLTEQQLQDLVAEYRTFRDTPPGGI